VSGLLLTCSMLDRESMGGSLSVAPHVGGCTSADTRGATRTWRAPLTHLDGSGGSPLMRSLQTRTDNRGFREGCVVCVPTRRHNRQHWPACIGETLSGGSRVVGTRGWGSWALWQTRDTRELCGCAQRGAECVRRAPPPEGTSVAGPRLAWPGVKDDRDPAAAYETASGATAADGGEPGL